jgi:hypothetical protein
MAILKTSKEMYWITGICLLVTTMSVAQQTTKTLEGVKGQWVISDDITPTEAREIAISQAKVEALRMAGVPEFVSESNVTYKAEKVMEPKEVFESLTTVDVSGEISEFSIVKEEKRLTDLGSFIYEVWINATVVIHSKARDPGFNMDVKGVRESYASPDKLTFEFKPWKDGFLTIFIISEKESGVLYPNRLEKKEKLVGQTSYSFPRSKALDYEVTTEGTIEVNYLLLLYTKQDIPFNADQTPENILRFIARIEPSEKCLKSFSLLIKK